MKGWWLRFGRGLQGQFKKNGGLYEPPVRSVGSSPALPLNWVSVAARPPFLLPPAAARHRVRGLDHHSMIDVN